MGLKVKRREELEVDLRLKRRDCGGGGVVVVRVRMIRGMVRWRIRGGGGGSLPFECCGTFSSPIVIFPMWVFAFGHHFHNHSILFIGPQYLSQFCRD